MLVRANRKEGAEVYLFYYLPTGLDVRRARTPTITLFLSAVCVTVFIIYRYVPSGGAWRPENLIFFPAAPSPATSLAHAFLHVGWLHLFGNIVYLVVFGAALEDRLGPGRFFMVFALSTVAGAWTHLALVALFSPAYLGYGVVGASGATSGLLGAFLVRLYFARITVAYWIFMPFQGVNRAGTAYVPALAAVVFWFVYQGIYALVQFGTSGVGVAYSVHVGGFAAGVACGFLFGALPLARAERRLAAARRACARADFFAAQALYLDYLEMRLDDSRARVEAARAFLSGADIESAREQFTAAVRTLLNRGRRGEAEDVMAEAMRAVPRFALSQRAHLDLACGMERSLKHRAALDAYANFALRYPESSDAPFVLLRAAGLLERRFSRLEKALECYERLVERYPDDSWVDFARGEIDRLVRLVRADGRASAGGAAAQRHGSEMS